MLQTWPRAQFARRVDIFTRVLYTRLPRVGVERTLPHLESNSWPALQSVRCIIFIAFIAARLNWQTAGSRKNEFSFPSPRSLPTPPHLATRFSLAPSLVCFLNPWWRSIASDALVESSALLYMETKAFLVKWITIVTRLCTTRCTGLFHKQDLIQILRMIEVSDSMAKLTFFFFLAERRISCVLVSLSLR